MNIEKNKWYENKKGSKRFVHNVISGDKGDSRLIVLYSTTGLERDMKENLYGSFLSWINKK